MIHSTIVSAQDLTPLLEIKPGETIRNKIKLSGSSKNFSYEIDKDKEFVRSVSIEFKMPMDSSKLIQPVCLFPIGRASPGSYDLHFILDSKHRKFFAPGCQSYIFSQAISRIEFYSSSSARLTACLVR